MFILTLEVRALVLYCFLSGRTSNVFHPSQTKDGIKLAHFSEMADLSGKRQAYS